MGTTTRQLPAMPAARCQPSVPCLSQTQLRLIIGTPVPPGGPVLTSLPVTSVGAGFRTEVGGQGGRDDRPARLSASGPEWLRAPRLPRWALPHQSREASSSPLTPARTQVLCQRWERWPRTGHAGRTCGLGTSSAPHPAATRANEERGALPSTSTATWQGDPS